MKPEKIDGNECQASFTIEEAALLGEMALSNGEIDTAVIFSGMAAVMELQRKAALATEQKQTADEATSAQNQQDATNEYQHGGSRADDLLSEEALPRIGESGNVKSPWFRKKRIRGVKRPPGYEKP